MPFKIDNGIVLRYINIPINKTPFINLRNILFKKWVPFLILNR